jgi:hypothetical protein
MASLAPRREALPRLPPREVVEVIAHRRTTTRRRATTWWRFVPPRRHDRRRAFPPYVSAGVRALPPPRRPGGQARLAQQPARNLLNQLRDARRRGTGATGELLQRLCNRTAARRREHQPVARVPPNRAVKRAHTPRDVGERGVPQRVVRGRAHQEVGNFAVLPCTGLLDEHELLPAIKLRRRQLRELPRAQDVRVDVPSTKDVQDRDPCHVGAHHARCQSDVRVAHVGQREHEASHLLVSPVVHAPA